MNEGHGGHVFFARHRVTNPKKRIEAIVTNRPKVNLHLSKRAGLVLAGLVAIATPAILGINDPSELRAQTQAAPKQEISGTWQGKLSSPQAPNGELRLVFKISTARRGRP